MRIHVYYFVGAIALATSAFFVGRRSAEHTELREIASDPKMAEAAKAVNSLSDWGKSFAEADAKRKADEEAAAAAEAKRQANAGDTVQNKDVRIHLEKSYRGKVLARSIGLRDDNKEPLGYDCLLVKYRIENVSADSLLDADARAAVDSFGNKLDYTDDYDYSDLLRLLALDKFNPEKIRPGESKYGYAAFKQPLPNAKWYIIKMVVDKANGESSKEPLYLKIPNN